MRNPAMPLHPTKCHPLTGQPLQAIFVRSDGRIFWPILGGSEPPPEPTPPAPTPPAPTPPAPPAPEPDKDLGFPRDTPVVEMTVEQQAAYWKHNSRRHEGRVKELVGDRTPEQIKADLAELQELKKAQLTPAEQALNAAREEGKAAARTEERTSTAKAIFRGALEAGGLEGDDLEELVSNFTVANYISDDGVDTSKITNFAKRFTASGKDSRRDPDFGAGHRRERQGDKAPGAAGKAEAQRRFAKTT